MMKRNKILTWDYFSKSSAQFVVWAEFEASRWLLMLLHSLPWASQSSALTPAWGWPESRAAPPPCLTSRKSENRREAETCRPAQADRKYLIACWMNIWAGNCQNEIVYRFIIQEINWYFERFYSWDIHKFYWCIHGNLICTVCTRQGCYQSEKIWEGGTFFRL